MKQRGHRREKGRLQSNGRQNGHTGFSKQPVSCVDSGLSAVKTEDKKDIFPQFSPWIVCAVTMAVRVNYVCQPKNWWILHPDEIYQTLEVAHGEVYGYGFRTYEYLAVPSDGNMTQMRHMEVRMGMHSMRSFLLPRFFIMISWLAGMLGYTEQPFMLWKASHAIVTSCLPYAVYRFTRSLFRSHDTGVIAAIMTAGSTHLSVFGTHTLINSFIGTPLFFALALLFENILYTKNMKSINTASAICSQAKNTVSDDPPAKFSSQWNDVCETPTANLNSNGNINLDPNHNHIEMNSKGPKEVVAKGSASTLANAVKFYDMNGNISHSDRRCDSVERDSNMNILQPITDPKKSVDEDISREIVLFASVLLTLCCYIRMDASLFVLVTALPFCTRKWLRRDVLFPVIAGAFIGVLIGILDDFNAYGFGVISPYNWFQFNVVRDFSAKIYGSMEWSWYISPLLLENPAIAMLLVLNVCAISAKIKFGSTQRDSDNLRSLVRLSSSLVVLLVFYSLKSHKELRFLYNFLVLLFIAFAFSINIIANLMLTTKYRHASQLLIIFTLIPYLFSQWYIFPSTANKSEKMWTYSRNTQSHDVNACFNYVNKQDDVTGVYTDHMIHMSGGYTLLHKNVPILGLIHYEFYEFSNNTRTVLKSSDFIPPKRNIAVSTFTQTAEFVSTYRMFYVLKLLITRKTYNYLIMDVDSNFLNRGYEVVFVSGTKTVLKRNSDTEQQRQLDAFAAKIPLGKNATLLTYEGDWLIKYGQYKLARERFLKAIELEPSILEAYKRLALSYTVLEDLKSSGKVMGKCIAAVNRKLCYERPKKIVLHEAYLFNL